MNFNFSIVAFIFFILNVGCAENIDSNQNDYSENISMPNLLNAKAESNTDLFRKFLAEQEENITALSQAINAQRNPDDLTSLRELI